MCCRFVRKHKGTGVRFLSAASVFLLLFALTFGMMPLPAGAADGSLEEQLDSLRSQSQQLQGQLDAMNSDLADAQARLSVQKEKAEVARQTYQVLQRQMDDLNGQIADKTEAIAQREGLIAEREADIADRKELLKDRLRAISKTGNLSAFQMLFNTESYADYLIKAKMMERISEQDKALMDEVEAEVQGIQQERAVLEQERASLDGDKAALQPLYDEAEANAAEIELLCQQIEREESDLQTRIAQTRESQERLERAAEQIRQEINNSQYDGKFGKMYWPVPAVKNIASPFGTRYLGGHSFHKGIDISEGFVPVYGKPIYAAADGVVISAINYANTSGFGYYVVIDHGYDENGVKITTLYAHCSEILVSAGQAVIGGETVIARAGDTGDVTGPHLHFEVWENGVAVDPVGNGYVPNYHKDQIIG